MNDIYDSRFVEKLFDEMSGTYEAVNYLSSFGFSKRWRRQFVREARIRPGAVVCDLMCGVGECWAGISSHLASGDRILALDLSGGMLRGAEKRRTKFPNLDIALSKQNALINSLTDGCADSVVCGFGIKTLSDEQKEVLASEIQRLLRPGGAFSLVEVSVPQGWAFERLYMFYLKRLIPVIGRLLLGNPENYRMLGVYAERFGDCRTMRDILDHYGLRTTYHEYFFGCASGVSGTKP